MIILHVLSTDGSVECMGFIELLVIGIGLAMDAFAVSICKGLSMKRLTIKKTAIVAAYFGFFQAFMPVIGYVLGASFKDYITQIDHWIAFLLLALIGWNMIKESREEESSSTEDDLSFKTMVVLAIATSIDALAVGITLAFLEVQLLEAVLIICFTTFVLSCLGVGIGHQFGLRYKSKAEMFGGIVLILMGLKILLSHLSVI